MRPSVLCVAHYFKCSFLVTTQYATKKQVRRIYQLDERIRKIANYKGLLSTPVCQKIKCWIEFWKSSLLVKIL